MRYFERQALDEKIQNQLDKKESKDWKKLTEHQRNDIVEKLQNLPLHEEIILKDHSFFDSVGNLIITIPD